MARCPGPRFASCKRQMNPVRGSGDLCLMRKTGTLDAGRRCVRSSLTGFPDNGEGPTDERTTTRTDKMKHEKGQGAHNDNGQATEQVATGTTTAQPAPVQATPTEAVRDLKAEAEAEHDHRAAEPILRSFTTNVQAIAADLKKASDGKALVKQMTATLTEHVDAAIAALENAGIRGPRLSRIMQAEFRPVLESVGWANAKDTIGRRCTHYGHRVRAPKEGEADRQAIAKAVKERVQALKAMGSGSVADQVERFREYWNASTPEQKAAIRAVVNADVMEPATV